jgi:TMEM175 potassium channel family protein
LSVGQSVPGLGKERLEALTDGIFATVMTVLVLSLSVPVITGGATNAEVATSLEALAPNILAYVLGFLLLAVLWISHHNVFHYMTRVDRPLLWLNTLFLLTIGFLPFSTALIGKYPEFQAPEVIFGANVVAISACMLGILSYSSRTGLLVVPERDERVMLRIRSRWRTGPLLYLSAILLSFVSPWISFAAYTASLIFMVVQSIFWIRTSSSNA